MPPQEELPEEYDGSKELDALYIGVLHQKIDNQRMAIWTAIVAIIVLSLGLLAVQSGC